MPRLTGGPASRRVRGPGGIGYTYRRARAWRLNPLGYLAVTFACGGVFLAVALAAGLVPNTATPIESTLPPPAASTPTITATLPPPTDTAVVVVEPTETATVAPTDTPIPSPTFHLIVPANPTPIPTPELPPAAPFPTSCDGPGRMNILLVGLDGRNSNYQRPARADAIAILGVNFGDKTAQFLSIPRDLWVPLPGLPANRRPEGKINTAYVWGGSDQLPGGGPGYLESVIAGTFNLRLDRFAVINFSAFEAAVDAIGGIDIEVPKAIHDERYPVGTGTMVVDIPAGPVHMDGETALIYARTRHQDGDFARMRRQQAVLMAMRDKVLRPESLPYLPSLVQALYSTVYTDLTLEDLALLGCAGPQIPTESISRYAIDNTMVYSWKAPTGESALQPKMEVIEPVLQVFNSGQ